MLPWPVGYVQTTGKRRGVLKPARFHYFDPPTTEAAVEILGKYGSEAKILAGGQSLMPLLNMRLARPSALVDINQISALDYIRPQDGGLEIGAIVRQRLLDFDPLIAEYAPLLRELTYWLGHPQIRNRGTIVGSIAHADPAGELPAATLALDATVTALGPRGERILSVDELYLGYLATSLEPDEMLTQVYIPRLPAGAGWSIKEVARRHGDFALVGVIAVVAGTQGRIDDARIVGFGVGGRPVRLRESEQLLVGASPRAELIEEAAERASQGVEPDSDIHASAEYRKAVTGVLVRRALQEAIDRAEGIVR